jgi:hypothetical protein
MTDEKKPDFEVTRQSAVVIGTETFRPLYGGPPPNETCRLCGNVQTPSGEPVTRSNDVVCNACGCPLAQPLNAEKS